MEKCLATVDIKALKETLTSHVTFQQLNMACQM